MLILIAVGLQIRQSSGNTIALQMLILIAVGLQIRQSSVSRCPAHSGQDKSKRNIKQGFKYIYKYSNTIALQILIIIAVGLQFRQSSGGVLSVFLKAK